MIYVPNQPGFHPNILNLPSGLIDLLLSRMSCTVSESRNSSVVLYILSINVFGLSVQPAEFLKLGFVIYFAAWLSGIRDKLHVLPDGEIEDTVDLEQFVQLVNEHLISLAVPLTVSAANFPVGKRRAQVLSSLLRKAGVGDFDKLVEHFGNTDAIYDYLTLDLLWDDCKECCENDSIEDFEKQETEEEIIEWIKKVKQFKELYNEK